MVVAQRPGELDLFDPLTYKRTKAIKFGAMPHWIAATSDNQFAYVTNEQSDNVSVIDLHSGKVLDSIPVGHLPRKIVIQPMTVAPSDGPIRSRRRTVKLRR